MMRCVRGTRNVVAKEWLARIDLVDFVQPLDGIIGHRRNEVPCSRWLTFVRVDRRGVAKKVWLPLAGIAANKPVKVLEAQASWPLIKRTSLAGSERRCVVVLPEPRGSITVVEQDTAYRRFALLDNTVVAGEAR